MPLHPQAKAVIEARRQAGLAPTNVLSAVEARLQAKARPATSAPPEPVHRVEDRTIPGPAGPLPVRIYWPSADTGLPMLVWYHGGGWVIGDLDQTDPACRTLANQAGAVVISADYRLAPEHRFPAAAEDAYAAALWAAEHAAEVHGDAQKLAVGGGSAGGNLAAVVPLMARDRGRPRIMHQLLVYPVIDYDFGTRSYKENADGYMLTRDSMQWFWHHYIGDSGEYYHPYASPIRASDLSGLPRAHVITAEFDPLRDEGEAYAERLRQAGVPTVCTRYAGQIHGFFGMTAMIDDAVRAIREAAAELRASLAVAAR